MGHIISKIAIFRHATADAIREQFTMRIALPAWVEKNFGQFLRFTGLSGLGWLLDFFLLHVFVLVFNFPIGLGNALSSCIASLFVFTFSREVIFRRASGNTFSRFLIYFVYTLSVILAASILAVYVHSAITMLLRSWHSAAPEALVVALTKIAITPPQLLLNYVVSKYMIESNWKRLS